MCAHRTLRDTAPGRAAGDSAVRRVLRRTGPDADARAASADTAAAPVPRRPPSAWRIPRPRRARPPCRGLLAVAGSCCAPWVSTDAGRGQTPRRRTGRRRAPGRPARPSCRGNTGWATPPTPGRRPGTPTACPPCSCTTPTRRTATTAPTRPASSGTCTRDRPGSRHWDDIGYNFLVDRCGTIYEGRAGGIDRAVVGAHTQGFNVGTTGIAAIGTFTAGVPVPKAMTDAIAAVAAWKLGLAGIDPRAPVRLVSTNSLSKYPAGTRGTFTAVSGHTDGYWTACPGAALMARLPEIRQHAAHLQGRLTGCRSRPGSPPAGSQVRHSRLTDHPEPRLLASRHALTGGGDHEQSQGAAVPEDVAVGDGPHAARGPWPVWWPPSWWGRRRHRVRAGPGERRATAGRAEGRPRTRRPPGPPPWPSPRTRSDGRPAGSPRGPSW